METDTRVIVAARALRGFAQSAVSVLVAIYLDLQGFSLVGTGVPLTCGSIGASVTAIVVGLFGDAFGRRRALLTLSTLMALTGIAFATSESFVVLAAIAFVIGAAVKIAYDLALWRLFYAVEPPEETASHEITSPSASEPRL